MLHNIPISPSGSAKKFTGIVRARDWVIPYEVGIVFNQRTLLNVPVLGYLDTIEDMIIDCDILNQYYIALDGPQLMFSMA